MCQSKLNWKSSFELHGQLSETQKDWLFDNRSLTEKLILLSQNNFSLEILSEQEQWLREDEYFYLNTPPSQKQWVREVVLKGYDQPWVYARSIIITKVHSQQSLKNIGLQPLGFILFTDKNFKRSEIESVLYPVGLLPFKILSTHLWARRSCFFHDKQWILVQEIFLPTFWHTLQIS